MPRNTSIQEREINHFHNIYKFTFVPVYFNDFVMYEISFDKYKYLHLNHKPLTGQWQNSRE